MVKITDKEKVIGAHEEQLANAIADKLLEKPAFSILMVLFPFLLLPFFQRCQAYKKNRELFVNHWLYTKRLALSAASRLVDGVNEAVIRQDAAVLATTSEPTQDRPLREVNGAQNREIQLLIRHYQKLLGTQSEDFDGMVREVYSASEFKAFISELSSVEEEVGEKAKIMCSQEQQNVAEIVATLAQETASLRNKEIERIFSKK